MLLTLTSGTAARAGHASVCASTARWPDYQIIIWQDQTPLRLSELARLGVTAGRVFGTRGVIDVTKIPREIAAFRAMQLRWYIENIATDFYAAYHRWHTNHPVTWLFDKARRLHRERPGGITAFTRSPSLSDPAWLNAIASRLRQHVQTYARFRPLYYNLADEAGIADLAAAWDFDFAPASLAAMRVWLRQRYGMLDALNREWGSHFRSWNSVKPMTTDAALTQANDNFSAWADFKEWMDVAFAHAVRVGTMAIHAADPGSCAGLEGAQPPGWGGYNYSHLAKAVDVLETYDADNNVEIARSVNPDLITLTTSSVASPQDIHSIWHELLLGGRGLVLWDPDNAFVEDNGNSTERGRALGLVAAQLRSGIAAQLIASMPATDPIAILYSPASFRTQWLLDRKADGQPWAQRGSGTEDADKNQVRTATRRFAEMLTHLGVQPSWVTREMVEQGVLRNGHIRVLMLPHAIALSPAEAQQIRTFTAQGGVVLADTEPGLFDAHSRRLDHPLLADLTGAERPVELLPILLRDAAPNDPTPLAQLQQTLEKSGAAPRFTVRTPSGALTTDVDVRVFRDGKLRIIGLQSDWDIADDRAGKVVILDFGAPVYVYHLGRPGPPEYVTRIRLTLDPATPELLVVAPAPLAELALTVPAPVRLGTIAEVVISSVKPSSAATSILHVELIAPDGTAVAADTANFALRGTKAIWRLPLTANDPTGKWTIRIVDVLSGQILQQNLIVLGAMDSSDH